MSKLTSSITLVKVDEGVYRKAQEFVKNNKIYFPNVKYLADIAILKFIKEFKK